MDNKISEENNRIELINDLKEYTKSKLKLLLILESNKAEVLKAERNEESDEDLLRIQTPAEYDRMYGDIYNKDMWSKKFILAFIYSTIHLIIYLYKTKQWFDVNNFSIKYQKLLSI